MGSGDDKVNVKGREFLVRVLEAEGRRATARLLGNVITMRIPPSLGSEESRRVYGELRAKMARKLERTPEEVLERLLSPGPRYVEFHDGEELKVLGKIFTVAVVKGTAQKTSVASLKGANVVVKLACGLPDEAERDHVSNLVRRVIARSLAGGVRAKVEDLNKRHFGFVFRKVAIKEQSSRWGSCSSDGNINLNFRLLVAPEDVLDYVIVHELAHLKEHNHSAKFWQIVGKAMPDYAEKIRWLKENGDKAGVSCAI